MQTMNLALITLIIHSLPVLSLITCPKQCICHEHSIACSCERDEQSEIIITSLGSTYITSLVVHTCPKVTVSNGSFAGVVLVERLSFIGIERLYFEPHAFKDILQSPRQFVIDECHIPSLSPTSLAGLSHIDHLWFRNSKIDIIATEAFHYVANIDYIYFHKMKLGKIERKSFSKMYQIAHLYFKHSIEIDEIDSEAFSKSQIGELIFDDARISTAHHTFLSNSDIGDTVVHNSTVYLIRRNVKHVAERKFNFKRCKITNSIFNAIGPATIGCLELHVANSKFHRIQQFEADKEIDKKPGSISIRFENCSIDSLDPFAFSNYSIESLVFNGTTIGTIQTKTFENSEVKRAVFENSKIFEIESASFVNSSIVDLSFDSMDIKKIKTEWIKNCSIENVEIVNSKIGNISRYLVKDSRIQSLQISNSRIQNLDPLAFYGKNQISTFHLTANDLATHLPTAFLSTNPSHHPTNLLLANNTIDCSPTQCSTNAFLLNSPKHAPLLWRIANNKCRPPVAATPCVSPRIVHLDEYGIACRVSWQVAECACTNPHAIIPFETSNIFGTDVSVLIIGDCELLSIGRPLIELTDETDANRVYTLRAPSPISPINTITQLYVFRTTKCDLNQLPSSLKALKIYHSSLSLNGPFGHLSHPNSRQIWQIAHTHVTHIGQHAFTNLHLSELTIDASRIAHIPSSSTIRTKIDSLRIRSSHLELTKPLFAATNTLEMRDSIVFSTPRGLGAIVSAQLQNNTLLECCRAANFDHRCETHFTGVTCQQYDAPDHLKSASSSSKLHVFQFLPLIMGQLFLIPLFL